jgi:hypothetical protein
MPQERPTGSRPGSRRYERGLRADETELCRTKVTRPPLQDKGYDVGLVAAAGVAAGAAPEPASLGVER